MSVTRRRFLVDSCTALASSLHPPFAWSSSNTADSIRTQYPTLYRDLAVADSTSVSNRPEARVTLYGAGTPPFDLPTEILFRRYRVVALATIFGSSGSSDLSSADEEAVHQYVEGLAHTPDPSVVDRLESYLGSIAPSADTSFDIAETTAGIGALVVGRAHPYSAAALSMSSLLMPWIKKGADYFWPQVQDADEAAVRGAISQYESARWIENLPQYSALKELLGIPFDSPSDDLLARLLQHAGQCGSRL